MGNLEAGHLMWLFEECIWLSLVGQDLSGMQKNGEAASHPLSPHHFGLIAAEIVSHFSR